MPTIKVKIQNLFEPETKGTFTFAKIWAQSIEHDPKFNQPLEFMVSGKLIDLPKSLNIGDIVDIDYNLRGNEYNGRKVHKPFGLQDKRTRKECNAATGKL